MRVALLEITEYDPDGWSNHATAIANPHWDQIESSVRVLDRTGRPFVKVFLDPSITDDHYMTVMGGEGVYWVAVTTGAHDQRRLFDPRRSSEEVPLWMTDQGYSDHAFHVCDLTTALQAARYFAEHADCDPALQWE